jgi:hypothetical protein
MEKMSRRKRGSQKEVIQAFVEGREFPYKSYGYSGNVFFEGDVLYSYGHHFPMMVRGWNGLNILNGERYSASTSKHQAKCRGNGQLETSFSMLGRLIEDMKLKRVHRRKLPDELKGLFKERWVADVSPVEFVKDSKIDVLGEKCFKMNYKGVNYVFFRTRKGYMCALEPASDKVWVDDSRAHTPKASWIRKLIKEEFGI